MSADLKHRIEINIKIDDNGCWLWQRSLNNCGYGRITLRFPDKTKKTALAHRVSYQVHKGQIPCSLTIDHLCMVRSCVNPSHLEAVTMKENLSRGNPSYKQHIAQTHCKNGHEFTEDNTYTYGTSRKCKTCNSARGTANWRKYYKFKTVQVI